MSTLSKFPWRWARPNANVGNKLKKRAGRGKKAVREKSVTIEEVARRSGVSPKTVSRVVNRESVVRQETREKVSRAIKELGYRPHPGARIMRGRRSGIIGMITSAISETGQPASETGLSSIHIVRGVQEVCRAKGFTLMIADSRGKPGEIEQLTEIFNNHRVEGVIYAADHHKMVEFEIPSGTRAVLANCFGSPDIAAVVPDDAIGQKLAANHLFECGHRRIGMVALNPEVLAAHLRRKGLREACELAGVPQNVAHYRTGIDPNRLRGKFCALEEAIRSLLSSPERPTAIMFGNDLLALRAWPALASAGICIPRDLSVIGFDNDERICDALIPRLTTVALPYFEIGCRAAKMLFQMIERGAIVCKIEKVPCYLVRRESTGSPSSGDDDTRSQGKKFRNHYAC